MDGRRVAFVIPALNESATIAAVVRGVSTQGLAIVVDDGSSDGTGAVAAGAGAEVVTHSVNEGYEAALNSGFRRARELGREYVVTLDADGQHDPALVSRFLEELEGGSDLVIGVRHRMQRVSETLFGWAARRIWGIDDPLCGLKAYRRTLYDTEGEFDRTRSVGTELAIRSVARGCRFAQVPVVTRERHGQPRFAGRLRANMRILRAMTILLFMHASGQLAARAP